MTNGQFNTITINGKANTLLYLPTNYNAAGKYPLIIFLHGMGEAGTDLNKVLGQGLPKVVQDHISNGDISSTDLDKFLIVAQQYPGAPYYSPTADWTFELLNELKASYSIDVERVYLTGLSAGGNRITETIAKYPNMAAASVPMSTSEWIPDYTNFKDQNIWLFAGASDTDAYTREKSFTDAINKIGGHAVLTVYNGGHGNWTTYYDPSWKWIKNEMGKDIGIPNGMSIYEWLLQYSLSDQPTQPIEPSKPTEPIISPVSPTDKWAINIWNNRELTDPIFRSMEADAIDYDFGIYGIDGSNRDKFSFRAIKTSNFDAGEYQITVSHDDGMRVYVDGALVYDQWKVGRLLDQTANINLTEGAHEIKIEFYEESGNALCKFDIQSTSQTHPVQPVELQFTLVSQVKTDSGYSVTLKDQNGKEYTVPIS